MDQPGFRRRIRIAPMEGSVTAALEDDWHRMTVTLSHEAEVVTAVDSDMLRWPWTTCPGAIAQLDQTFTGVPLALMARRGERAQNCTHLHDLALFAAAHAAEAEMVIYDVRVSDPVDGRRDAKLDRNGQALLAWSLAGDRFVGPGDLAGRTLADLGDWISTLDSKAREAVRILRWASIMAYGRGMAMPAGMPATTFPAGACFTFQPDRVVQAVRRAGVHRDLSGPDAELLGEGS